MFVKPAMFIGTIDFYHFSDFSLTLTLAGGCKISIKGKPLGFIFSHSFDDQDEIGYGVEAVQAEHPDIIFE